MHKICLVIVFVVSCNVAIAAPRNPYGGTKFYSKTNSYQGRITDSGMIMDKSNKYRGRIDSKGKLYDTSNRYQGQFKK